LALAQRRYRERKKQEKMKDTTTTEVDPDNSHTSTTESSTYASSPTQIPREEPTSRAVIIKEIGKKEVDKNIRP